MSKYCKECYEVIDEGKAGFCSKCYDKIWKVMATRKEVPREMVHSCEKINKA